MYQINTKRSLRSALLLGAASAAALSMTVPASAQDDTGTVETVVVTGSRIPQQGLYSTSPVSAIGSQEFKLQGAATVGETLKTLPSTVEDGDSNTVDNGTSGIATIDLRNLGAKRTLILVDGKRLVPANSSGLVDTNQIPAAMVDHVEVLTGGASAVYGSDAVSGVVNIILKKDFTGMLVDAQYSETDHGDGGQTDVSSIMGFNSGDGKGNVTIYGNYTHRSAVPGAARNFGAHALGATNFTGCASPPTHFGGLCFSGSGTIAEGRDHSTAVGGPFKGQGDLMFTPSGTLVPYDGRTFNFAPFQFYQTEGTRYAFGANGHYDINKHLSFYTRLTFSDNQSTSQLGPTPLNEIFTLNCGNPLMSAEERETIFGGTGTCASAGLTDASTTDIVFGQRLSTAGNRITNEDHSAYQIVVGAKGELGWGWTYDVSAQYGHTNEAQRLDGDASFARFQQGLLVNPNGTCTDPSGGCVPINIFRVGGINQAAIDFFRLGMDAIGSTDQWDVQAYTEGDLGFLGLQSPWAKSPASLVLGTEYRQEQAAFRPDDNLATGNLLGFEAEAPVAGRYNVEEGFTELSIPLVQGVPFIQDLSFDGAYRYSSYNLSGPVSTYKYSAEWAPTDDFKLRASFERAIRAPNIAELFGAVGRSTVEGPDPCSQAGLGSIPTTAALCVATGVPAAKVFSPSLNCPTTQCQGAVGGNPNLNPEISDTRTAGIVLTPTFLDGFTATVDYYNIKIDGFIGQVPSTFILNHCYNPAFNSTQVVNNFCQDIHRDSAGTLFTSNGFIADQEANIAVDQVKGWDFEANYNADLGTFGMDGAGSIALNFMGTLVTSNKFEPTPGSGFVECKGLWGLQCGEPENKLKSNLRMTWISPANDITLSLRWRYLSEVRNDTSVLSGRNANTQCGFNFCYAPNFPALHNGTIPAFNYFDLSGTWSVTDGIDLRAGVSNIFNKRPPLVDNNAAPPNDINNNTFPNTYDALGRIIFAGVTVKY